MIKKLFAWWEDQPSGFRSFVITCFNSALAALAPILTWVAANGNFPSKHEWVAAIAEALIAGRATRVILPRDQNTRVTDKPNGNSKSSTN